MNVNETVKRMIFVTIEMGGVERRNPPVETYREAVNLMAEACRCGGKVTKIEKEYMSP
jgi:hypothetical protein